MVSFNTIPPKRAGPEALLVGNGLISEEKQDWNDDVFELFLSISPPWVKSVSTPSVIDVSALLNASMNASLDKQYNIPFIVFDVFFYMKYFKNNVVMMFCIFFIYKASLKSPEETLQQIYLTVFSWKRPGIMEL